MQNETHSSKAFWASYASSEQYIVEPSIPMWPGYKGKSIVGFFLFYFHKSPNFFLFACIKCVTIA